MRNEGEDVAKIDSPLYHIYFTINKNRSYINAELLLEMVQKVILVLKTVTCI